MKPDWDFSKETYPCLSIYQMDITPSPYRACQDKQVVSIDPQSGLLITETPAIPYEMSYQFDFWTTLQTDMNEITEQWCTLYNRAFNLPVVDKSGTERTCLAYQVTPITKADRLTGSSRLFRSLTSYKIWVEIDVATQTQHKIITDIDLVLDNEMT